MPVRPQRDDLAIATGRRLRALREARGTSLGALAAASGLGKGTLSELETGRRNPTLATLFAVTTALGVPIGAALPPHAPSEPAAPIAGDAIVATPVARFDDLTAVSELYRTTLAGGATQDSAPHAPGVTEHWIVYAGTVELGPLDAPLRLGPGETGTFTADVPHRYVAAAGPDVQATLLVRYPR